jgi:ABC-type nitrate/sulfonate/bicarbonate transport system permease component
MATRSTETIGSWLPEALWTDQRVIFVEAIVSFVLLWSLVANALDMVDTISSPSLLALSTLELLGSLDWVHHVAVTLRRTLLGFLVTMVVGTVLGVLMGWSDFFGDALKDYVIIGLALPSLFAVVFSAMWFGISDATPMMAAAAISFPFVTQGIFQSVQDIDADLLDMSSAFDVSRLRVARRVVVGSIMPEWFAGARYAFAICWKITTLAEFLVGTDGIGFMIGFEMDQLSITGVLTWTFLFMMIIVVVEYGVFQRVEKLVFDWRQTDEITWA